MKAIRLSDYKEFPVAITYGRTYVTVENDVTEEIREVSLAPQIVENANGSFSTFCITQGRLTLATYVTRVDSPTQPF